MQIDDFLIYFSRILTLLLVIPLHEAAHAFSAKLLGDDTAEHQGRLTVNPLAHIDPIGSILMIFTGFGWAKPVPVNPLRMKKYRAGFALTALAGPLSNLIAAIVAAVAFFFIYTSEAGRTAYINYAYQNEISILYCVSELLQFLFSVNIGLAVFNLIPVPPLDGFNILRAFTGEKFDRWVYRNQRYISYGFIAVILFLRVIPNRFNPLYIVSNFVAQAIWNPLIWIFGLK